MLKFVLFLNVFYLYHCFLIQDALRSISSPKAKTDFLSGENGAVKLTKDQVGSLEEFGRLVRPSRRQHESEEEFVKALQASADHLMSLIEGKGKKVQGCKSTYKELKDLLEKIKATGYFIGKSLRDDKVDSPEVSNDSVDGAGVSKPKDEGTKKSKNVENGKQEKRHRNRGGQKEEKPHNNHDQETTKVPIDDLQTTQHYQASGCNPPYHQGGNVTPEVRRAAVCPLQKYRQWNPVSRPALRKQSSPSCQQRPIQFSSRFPD